MPSGSSWCPNWSAADLIMATTWATGCTTDCTATNECTTAWITWRSTTDSTDAAWAGWSDNRTAATTVTIDFASDMWVEWNGIVGKRAAEYKEARKVRKKREREARRQAK